MKNRITECCKKAGCDVFGITQARKFDELKEILYKRGRVSLAEENIEKRINPFFLMPQAKSIIVCLFSYFTGEKGDISSYSHGKDYHIVLKERLGFISEPLKEEGYMAEGFLDNAPLSDRHLAYLCGLGFFGKNGMLINEKLGSEFFIGYILTNCEFSYDKPLKNTKCIGCNKCIISCPGGALGEEFAFDETKCVSYITQKKGELTEEEKERIVKSGYVWGCDVCREVCPHNRALSITPIPEFKENLILNADFDYDISNSEFMRLYSDRAFSWRGKNVLNRNKKLYE